MIRRHSRSLPWLVAVLSAVACSSDRNASEPIGTATQAVSTCGDATFGAPCDPDGTGPLSTCQGACYVARTGGISCMTLTAIGWDANTLDGRVCGPLGSECNMVCSSGACNALGDGGLSQSNGQACRAPSTTQVLGNTCSGACENGACLPIADACRYGRQSAGPGNCSFSACDFSEPHKCVSYPLLADSACNDADFCTGNDRCQPSDAAINPVCMGTRQPICPADGGAVGGAGGVGFGGFGGLTGGTGGIGFGGIGAFGGATGGGGRAGTSAGGGAGTSNAGTSGTSQGGRAGASGGAGTSAGGGAGTSAGGTAGTSSGGTAGTSASGAGGTAGGAAGGTAGGSAGGSTGGTAGGSTGGTAGASTGGTAGASTTGGTAGASTTGGSAGSSTSGGASQGGRAGTGNSTGGRDAGTGRAGSSILGADAEDEGSCGCRVAAPASSARSLFGVLLGALAVWQGRRRRKTVSRSAP